MGGGGWVGLVGWLVGKAVWNFSENSSVLVALPVPKQIHFSQERAGYILEYQICPLVPLILIKKCLFPSFPFVCALGRPASMPVTSPRWDILGKLEKEEAMDYLQTWFPNENLLAGMICMTLWQCSPSGTWVVMPLGSTAVLGRFRTAWVAKSSRILRWWWWVTTNHAQVQQLLRPGLGLGHLQQLRAHPRQGFKYSRGFFF